MSGGMTRRLIILLVLSLAACASGSRVDSAGSTPGQGGQQTDAGSQTGSGGDTGNGSDAGSQANGGSDAGQPAAAQVVSLSIAPASPSVPRGAQEELIATASWSDGTTTDVTGQAAWTVSDGSIASLFVSTDGPHWAKGEPARSASISASLAGQA